mgnify:CR=1 FL=1
MKLALQILIMLAGWTTLLIHLYLNQTSVRQEFGLGVMSALSIYFSYFTVLSNYLATLAITLPFFLPDSRIGLFLSKPINLSGLLLYILLVGILYPLLLADRWNPQGARKLSVILSHYVVPPLFLSYWLLYVPKGTLPLNAPFLWVIFPTLYALSIFVRGALTNIYPYPFMDISEKGFPEVLIKSISMIGLFLAGGFLVVWLDKLLS